MAKRLLSALQILKSQGFGTRKECASILRTGYFRFRWEQPDPQEWQIIEDPKAEFPVDGLWLDDGKCQIPYRENLYLAFHKPAGVECSRSPSHNICIFDFFPRPFLTRGLQAVGRLDADTTGLILFTDDGEFNHRLNAPQKHVMRSYKVEALHPLSEEQLQKLRTGVFLRGEETPTLPARVHRLDEKGFEIGLREGRYHQIKRMLGAVGNRCASIHRFAIGGYTLPDTLEPKQWAHLSPEDRKLIHQPPGDLPGD